MSLFDKIRNQKVLSFTLILFTLSLGIVLGTLVNRGVSAAKDDKVVAQGATPLVIPNAVELSNSFSQIAKQMEPSVVNISTSYFPKAQARSRGNNNGRRQIMRPDDDQGDSADPNDFFQRFFGGGSPFGGSPETGRRGSALGSGVVVDRAGYILANNHVVEQADRIQVRFNGDPVRYEG